MLQQLFIKASTYASKNTFKGAFTQTMHFNSHKPIPMEESLLKAVKEKNKPEVKYYLTKPINLNHVSEELGSIFHAADSVVTRFFLKFPVNPNLLNTKGNAPLHDACNIGYYDKVERLLSHKDINPNIQNQMGRTPLHYATMLSNSRITELLLSHKNIKPGICDNFGNTALHTALTAVNIETILRDGRINPKAQNIFGETALHEAVENGMIKLVEAFLKHDRSNNYMLINPSIKNLAGDTPIDIAFQEGYVEIAKLLASHPYHDKENAKSFREITELAKLAHDLDVGKR
ncbi:MAG: ankyrin repeat domain-containing protein [Alphaproteobacteria bacterium]|nr:ankyrin repeat domain-containing protein [Alphaproteobacteria bacterium]OJV15835.1 MAG: hypothetical protein BGO27_07980 [Alphaproteobacteria bacterium 33-17]